MNKRLTGLVILSALGMLTGCTSTHSSTASSQENKTKATTMISSSTDQKTHSLDTSVKYAQGLGISLKEVSTAEQGDKKILSIKVKAENKGNEEKGFGSIDFRLKQGEKSLEPYNQGENFGEAIEKGKTYEGIMTFEVPKDSQKGTLSYQPRGKEKASWKISY